MSGVDERRKSQGMPLATGPRRPMDIRATESYRHTEKPRRLGGTSCQLPQAVVAVADQYWSALSIFAPGSGCETAIGRDVDRVLDELDGPVSHGEIRTAGVEASEAVLAQVEACRDW